MCKQSIITYESNSGSTKHIAHLYGSTPYGDYLLLKEKLRLEEFGINQLNIHNIINHKKSLKAQVREMKRLNKLVKNNKNFRQLIFNTNFLHKKKNECGSLMCVFCGKPDLIIYHWTDNKKDKNKMATADHFNPKSNGGDAFNEDNLVVSCYKCNNKKKSKLWSIRTLRYLSFYGDFKTLVKKLVY